MPKPSCVWIIDDDRSIRWVLEKALLREDIPCMTFSSASDALRELERSIPAAVLSDIRMPGVSGLELLQALKERLPKVPVIIMTAYSDLDSAVAAFQGGAFEYLPKPFDVDQALELVRRALAENASRDVPAASDAPVPEILGQAPAMQEVFRAIGRLSQSHATVLITGESGSGKELVARALHRHSPRASGPFIALNTAAIPKDLLESELFGHERGAFTDARTARQGLFEAAHGGTLFLDELPSLSLPLQAKVLTALEDRKIRRLGGNRQIEVDVRIIAATNRDLRSAVDSGEFREDLLQRLDLLRVNVPAVRERGEDVLRLAEHLTAQLCRQHRLPRRRISEAGQRRLLAHPWPGNVRELAHELERALVFEDAASLDFAHLPAAHAAIQCAGEGQSSADWLNPGFVFPEEGFVLEDAISRLMQLALRQSGSNVSKAARRLGTTRDFVRYRLYGDRKEKSPAEIEPDESP
jgi:two-component system nitrogen regulation response regulator GlnG